MRGYVAGVITWLLENDMENRYSVYCTRESMAQLQDVPADFVLVEREKDIRSHAGGIDAYFCPLGVLYPRPVWKPTIVTLPDIQQEFFPEFFTPQARRSRAVEHPVSVRAADRVLTISSYSRETIIRRYNTDPERIKVAPLWASDAFYRSSHVSVPVPFEQFLLYPANRWPHKNHDTLLRAIAALAREGRRATLVITGRDIPGGYPLIAKACEYGIRDQIWDAGYVPEADLALLYRQAHALVFPSLFEGFGIPAVEAMAAGCPVAVANTTSLPEVCGDAAVYFDPLSPASVAEAIVRLDDSSLREQLVNRGRDRARQYSVERTALIHLEAFREAVASYSRVRTAWQTCVHEPVHRIRVW